MWYVKNIVCLPTFLRWRGLHIHFSYHELYTHYWRWEIILLNLETKMNRSVHGKIRYLQSLAFYLGKASNIIKKEQQRLHYLFSFRSFYKSRLSLGFYIPSTKQILKEPTTDKKSIFLSLASVLLSLPLTLTGDNDLLCIHRGTLGGKWKKRIDIKLILRLTFFFFCSRPWSSHLDTWAACPQK